MKASFALLVGPYLVAGCGSVDPKVGALQAVCGLQGAAGQQAAHGASYPGAAQSQSPIAPTCEAEGGSACNNCENLHCCATHSACYGDPVCACADLALDRCRDAADTAEDSAAEKTRCSSDFSAKGKVEQERLACQRAWCKTECEIE